MLSFSESRFPTDISYGISGGPVFHTDIVETISGHEYRNMFMPYGRNKYNLASAIKTKENLDQVICFFRAMRGRAIGFRFKDWFDYSVINQLIGVGDGKTKEFQLVKTYAVGDLIEYRKISKPATGTVKVFVVGNGTVMNVDYISGKILFQEPPANGAKITANFEFDVPVRFDTDAISASLENYGVHSHDEIPLIEIVL